tara:strand:+ start:459 stop:698 length:240 start_codon:yes stop_codon:yes gene_type:complete
MPRPPPPKNKGKDLVNEGKAKQNEKNAKQNEKNALKKQEKLIQTIHNDLDSLKDLMEATSIDSTPDRSSAPPPKRPPKK